MISNRLIKFELLTQSIMWLAPRSAADPPVRMGLTNMLGGLIINICMKTWFASCSFEYITAFYVMQVKAG